MSGVDRSGDTLQRRSLAAYLSLVQRHTTWSRRLLMASAADHAAAFTMGTLAAGGAVLWTCPDESILRASGQDGLSDFQVTSLGEALRILKNEIRKGLPVSVAVLDAENTVWTEAVTRGLQPDAVLVGEKEAAAAAVLLERGADRLGPAGSHAIAQHSAQTWRELRAFDASFLTQIEEGTGAERGIAEQWLRAAPRLFPRDLARCYASHWVASNSTR